MFTKSANNYLQRAQPIPTRAQNVTNKEQNKRVFSAISPFGKINQDLTQSITDSEAKSISTTRNQTLANTTNM